MTAPVERELASLVHVTTGDQLWRPPGEQVTEPVPGGRRPEPVRRGSGKLVRRRGERFVREERDPLAGASAADLSLKPRPLAGLGSEP